MLLSSEATSELKSLGKSRSASSRIPRLEAESLNCKRTTAPFILQWEPTIWRVSKNPSLFFSQLGEAFDKKESNFCNYSDCDQQKINAAPTSYDVKEPDTRIQISLKSRITSKQRIEAVGPGQYEIQKSDMFLKKSLASSFSKQLKTASWISQNQSAILGPGTYSNVLALNNSGKCPVSIFPNVPAHSMALKTRQKGNSGLIIRLSWSWAIFIAL